MSRTCKHVDWLESLKTSGHAMMSPIPDQDLLLIRIVNFQNYPNEGNN